MRKNYKQEVLSVKHEGNTKNSRDLMFTKNEWKQTCEENCEVEIYEQKKVWLDDVLKDIRTARVNDIQQNRKLTSVQALSLIHI